MAVTRARDDRVSLADDSVTWIRFGPQSITLDRAIITKLYRHYRRTSSRRRQLADGSFPWETLRVVVRRPADERDTQHAHLTNADNNTTHPAYQV